MEGGGGGQGGRPRGKEDWGGGRLHMGGGVVRRVAARVWEG